MQLGASLPRCRGSGLSLWRQSKAGSSARLTNPADSSAEAARHSFSAGKRTTHCLPETLRKAWPSRCEVTQPRATGQECGVELKPQELVELTESFFSPSHCFCGFFCFSSPPSMGLKKASNHFLGPGRRVPDPQLQPSLPSLGLTVMQVTSPLGGKYRQPEVCVLAFAAQPRP